MATSNRLIALPNPMPQRNHKTGYDYQVEKSWKILRDGEHIGYMHLGNTGYFGTDLNGNWVTCWHIGCNRQWMRDAIVRGIEKNVRGEVLKKTLHVERNRDAESVL